MATQTLSTADAILKDLYVGPIIEQLNYKTYLLDQIERDSDSIDHTGRRAVWPVHKSNNRGRGVLHDGGQLPTAGRQDWMDAIIPIKYHAYGISVSDAAIEGSKRNEGAFINILEAETKGVAQGHAEGHQPPGLRLGDGLLASAVSAAARRRDGGLGAVPPRRRPRRSRRQVHGRRDGGIANVTITARDTTNKTVTLSSAPTTPASINSTYGLYLSGSRGNEMDGLRNILTSGARCTPSTAATAGNEFWNPGSARMPAPRWPASPCSSRSPTTSAAWATARSRCS
jgi:hypothetical protein